MKKDQKQWIAAAFTIAAIVSGIAVVATAGQADAKKERETRDKLPPTAIVVNLYYTGKDGAARRFAREMEESGVAAAIRKADGNLRYEYFVPLDDEETVMLVDAWRDQSAIDRHHASPAMAKIAQLRDKYDLHMRVERFKPDEDGVPKRDQSFIRE